MYVFMNNTFVMELNIIDFDGVCATVTRADCVFAVCGDRPAVHRGGQNTGDGGGTGRGPQRLCLHCQVSCMILLKQPGRLDEFAVIASRWTLV